MADTTADLDPKKVAEFQSQMGGYLNAASAALMISIGHRTGLFDTMAAMPAATSASIAARAGLNERYVREWLGAMVAAKVIVYDPNKDEYSLPAEHASLTTSEAGPGNLARIMQFVPLLATVETKVIDKFHNGGGVPYSEYEDFHRIMAEVSGAQFDAGLVDEMLPLVPGMVDALEAGTTVADVGTGSGHAVNVMASAFPQSQFVGFDFSENAIDVARAEAESLGLTNARFEVQDAAALDGTNEFDFVTTFDAVHDQARPRDMVSSIYRILKPGGYWLCADICASSHVGENVDHPIGVFGYTVSCMHCMTVSLAYDGEGLGAMWGVHQARQIFAEAGFKDIHVNSLENDPTNNYYVCHKA
ncbi:MAG: class I SAM-dependent methyltransferase [Acidimicrobiales bacterium]